MRPPKGTPRLPASLSSLILLISASVPLAATEPSLTDDSQCDCYLTNGNRSSYFTEHRFFDFRSLSEYAGVPPIIRDPDATADADETSAFFTTPAWTDFWMLGSWNNSRGGVRSDATALMVNSPNNVYIEASSDPDPSSQTFLTLRTQRVTRDFQTAAEIESVSAKFKYLSLRARMRTRGAAGAVTAMFAYRGADTLAGVQESDLEVRTADPRTLVHYTNQPSYTDDGDVIAQATRNATLPAGRAWSDWAVHRMDWTPRATTWFVDGVPVAQIDFQVPRDECNVILNAWGDGGGWTGNMSAGDAAYLQVQWLEIVFNSTEPRDGGDGDGDRVCHAVCSIDRTTQLGTPVMLWDNAASGRMWDLVGWLSMGVAMLVMLVSTGLVV
ncbi:hypothetical protein VTK26DRAFT_6196 [Humicola hyalothermophila]